MHATVTGLEAELAMESVPVRIPMSDIYARVVLTEKPLR